MQNDDNTQGLAIVEEICQQLYCRTLGKTPKLLACNLKNAKA